MRILAIMLCIVISSPAFADPPKDADRPWATGVSQKNQDEAIKLFEEGTLRLKDGLFTKAVEIYKKALEFWDHPAIHFNIAKTLMNLADPIDAYKHLKLSLRFGGQPLDTDKIAQVQNHIKTLYETELAELTVKVQEPGALVTLDGAELFRGPGEWTGVVKPGRRSVLADKDGYQPNRQQPDLKAGTKTTLELTLAELDGSMRYERAFGSWIPWTVIGTGAAMLGGGGVFMWQSSKAFADYDTAIDECNTTTATPITDDLGRDTSGRVFGCTPTSAIKAKQDSGKLFNTLGIASLAAGGATLATGLVLLYINREKPIASKDVPVTVLPYVSPDGAGLSATLDF